jgi:hypothetical protein
MEGTVTVACGAGFLLRVGAVGFADPLLAARFFVFVLSFMSLALRNLSWLR